MVRTKGLVTTKELCEKFNVDRTTIWRDKKAITINRPLPEERGLVRSEVEEAIRYFEDMESRIEDELQDNNVMVDSYRDTPAVVGFLTIRVNLINQLRQCRQDRLAFEFSIGLLKEVPKRFQLDQPISDFTGNAIDEEERRVDLALLELKAEAEDVAGD